jgi:hypothetical protein
LAADLKYKKGVYMKKLISILLFTLPGMAYAHSAVVCDTSSDFGDVKLTITSATAMSDFFSVVNVIGDGTMRDVNVMAQAASEPTIPDQVVLKLKTLLPNSTEVDPNGIEATLTLKTKTISESPLVLQADGLGNLHITKGSVNRRVSNFPLTNCRGIL